LKRDEVFLKHILDEMEFLTKETQNLRSVNRGQQSIGVRATLLTDLTCLLSA